MSKEQIKEMIKELFKQGEIQVFVNNELNPLDKEIETKVEVWIDNECVSSSSDSVFLD